MRERYRFPLIIIKKRFIEEIREMWNVEFALCTKRASKMVLAYVAYILL